MPEELAFEQFARDRAAVERHEGTVAPAAVGMQAARHHLLAGTRFAEHEHRGIGIGYLAHHAAHRAQARADTHQLAKQLQLAVAATAPQRVLLAVDARAVQRIDQGGVGEGPTQRADQHRFVTPRRDACGGRRGDHHRHAGVQCRQRLERRLEIEALAVGGQQHHLWRLLARRGERPERDVGFVEEAENGGGGRAARGVVIQQQDVGTVRHALV